MDSVPLGINRCESNAATNKNCVKVLLGVIEIKLLLRLVSATKPLFGQIIIPRQVCPGLRYT